MKNIAVAAACITFAVLIGNSVNVSAESIPVTKKQVQLLSGVVKNVAKIKPVQKKRAVMWKSDCFPDSRR